MTSYVALAALREYNVLEDRVDALDVLIDQNAQTFQITLGYGALPVIFATYADFEAYFDTYATMAAGQYLADSTDADALFNLLSGYETAAEASQATAESGRDQVLYIQRRFPGTGGANLCMNPSFETNVDYWTAGSGETITRVTGVGLFGAYSLTTRTNLHPNPSLEVDTTGYANEGSSTIARVTTDARFGSACLQVTLANTASTSGNVATLASSGNRIPVTGGQTYTVSVYVKQTSGASTNYRCRVTEFDAITGGTQQADTAGAATAVTTGGGWVRLSQTVTVTATTTHLMPKVECSSGAASQVLLIDGVLVEQAGAVDTYFDGSTHSSPALAYSRTWAGTTHASQSSLQYYVQDTADCALLDTTVSGNDVFTLWNDAGGTQYVPCLPSQSYTFSGYVKALTNLRLVEVSLTWRDGTGAIIQQAYSPALTIAAQTLNTWGRFSYTEAAPANAVQVQPIIRLASCVIGDQFRLDGVMLEKSATVNEYIEGSPGELTFDSMLLVA